MKTYDMVDVQTKKIFLKVQQIMLFLHQVMCSTLNILKASLPIRFLSIGIRTLISDSWNLRSTKLLSISFSGMFV